MGREFIHERRVEFHETDLAGIVHFANFFRYMEAAECDFLRHLGLSIHEEVDGEARGWPRGDVRCRFTAPLRFDDCVRVRLSVASMSDKTITYQCLIERREGSDWIAAARGTSTAIHAAMDARDGSVRALSIPVHVRERIQHYLGTDGGDAPPLPSNHG